MISIISLVSIQMQVSSQIKITSEEKQNILGRCVAKNKKPPYNSMRRIHFLNLLYKFRESHSQTITLRLNRLLF